MSDPMLLRQSAKECIYWMNWAQEKPPFLRCLKMKFEFKCLGTRLWGVRFLKLMPKLLWCLSIKYLSKNWSRNKTEQPCQDQLVLLMSSCKFLIRYVDTINVDNMSWSTSGAINESNKVIASKYWQYLWFSNQIVVLIQNYVNLMIKLNWLFIS
jgi:hypothetical protein